MTTVEMMHPYQVLFNMMNDHLNSVTTKFERNKFSRRYMRAKKIKGIRFVTSKNHLLYN